MTQKSCSCTFVLEKWKLCPHKNISTNVHSSLVHNCPNRKQTRYNSGSELLNKRTYIFTMDYLLPRKNKETNNWYMEHTAKIYKEFLLNKSRKLKCWCTAWLILCDIHEISKLKNRGEISCSLAWRRREYRRKVGVAIENSMKNSWGDSTSLFLHGMHVYILVVILYQSFLICYHWGTLGTWGLWVLFPTTACKSTVILK